MPHRPPDFPQAGRRLAPCPSVVRAVVLALGIEDALPVGCLVGPLGIGVDEDLDLAAEEAGPNLEHGKVLLLDDQARERADDRRRGAPVDELARRDLEGGAVEGAHDGVADDVGGRGAPVDELARRDLEGGAVEGAHDGVADDVGALAHRRADVRAEVADAEQLAALILADQHVRAAQVLGPELRRRKVARLQPSLDPGERWEDDLRGVAAAVFAGCIGALAAGRVPPHNDAASHSTTRGTLLAARAVVKRRWAAKAATPAAAARANVAPSSVRPDLRSSGASAAATAERALARGARAAGPTAACAGAATKADAGVQSAADTAATPTRLLFKKLIWAAPLCEWLPSRRPRGKLAEN
eukprot:CAMPEP_0197942878 /NCGR_PEP_ID=MMETSP1439-20131203/124633_1 /TAXON_ID=66791 /ORGANISM="Gonyaulax spinifera, Strain CCMP409" /LENGTH=355 /DNA_ID=CAMNT_0043566135 /DNA_START=121 /DNA_END=1186 /DNA_ORIENTATION=+